MTINWAGVIFVKMLRFTLFISFPFRHMNYVVHSIVLGSHMIVHHCLTWIQHFIFFSKKHDKDTWLHGYTDCTCYVPTECKAGIFYMLQNSNSRCLLLYPVIPAAWYLPIISHRKKKKFCHKQCLIINGSPPHSIGTGPIKKDPVEKGGINYG